MDGIKRHGRSALSVASAGHAVFAATLIGLGIQGFVKRDFTTLWQPVPAGTPARELLIYLCAAISLACGIGILWRATAAMAARLLVAALALSFLMWKLRVFLRADLVDGTWGCGECLAILGAAWVLYAWFAADRDRERLRFATGESGLRIARALYGLALLPFGYAHFAYLQHTVDMVPHWLPWPLGWAYFTGGAFIAASLAIFSGVLARLAAALSALEMGLFGLLVWVPMLLAGPLSAFQQGEVASTAALTAAGWVVADSYRGEPWFGVAKRLN